MGRITHNGFCPLAHKHVQDERQCIGCDGCETDEHVAQATEGTIFPILTWHDKTDMDPLKLIQLGIFPPCIDQIDLDFGEVNEIQTEMFDSQDWLDDYDYDLSMATGELIPRDDAF